MSQDIDSDFQNSLKEDENLFGFHDNSDICLSNDNIWSSLDFNSPNNDPINLVNIFTQKRKKRKKRKSLEGKRKIQLSKACILNIVQII